MSRRWQATDVHFAGVWLATVEWLGLGGCHHGKRGAGVGNRARIGDVTGIGCICSTQATSILNPLR